MTYPTSGGANPGRHSSCSPNSAAEALPHPSVPLPPPGQPSPDGFYRLRIIATGAPPAVQNHVNMMYHYGYAQPWQWTPPVPTADPGEVMRVLTKQVPGPQ
ncbi:MAG: hypothetical protein WBA10_16030 [Elainellaceae cyanobacterium]